MGWKDFVPDPVEGWVEDRAEDVGDAIEWTGDKAAGVAEDIGLDEAGDWIRDKSRSAANRLGADVSELELGQTEDPKKLVYGSVSKIRAQVSHLKDFDSSFTLVGNGLKGLQGDGLKGASADAFQKAMAKEPPRWFKAADAFGKAADAMNRFAETVEWAQAQAKEALEEYNRAKKASQDARTAYNKSVTDYNAAVEAKKDTLPPRPSENFTDPAGPLIKAAQDRLDTARTQRNDVAETARTAVRAARDAAPPKPSYAEQLKDGMDYLEVAQTHLAGGVVKGTAGLANFVRSVNPMDPYNLTHPAEYQTSLNSTVAGLTVAVNDPMGAGKQMLNEFMKDPSEGIGKLIPELVGTKGLGALKKGATVARHADDLKGPGRAQLEGEGPGPASRTAKDTTCVEDPVDVATGRMVLPQTDLVLPGSLPLLFTRTFESSYRAGRWFGRRWASTLDQRLEIDAVGIVLVGEDGSFLSYPHPAPGLPVLPSHGRRWPLSVTPEGEYTVTNPETGSVLRFTAEGLLVQSEDRCGAWIAYEYDADGAPTDIRHSGGYHIRLAASGGRITSLSLADGTKVLDYGYTDGELTEVVNSCGRPLSFGLDERARIVSWTDTNGRRFTYTYDDQDRCIAQSGADGHVDSRFTYEDGLTTVTGALGHRRRYVVDDRSLVVAETDENGATTRFEWGPFNRLLSRVDPLGRATRMTYDDQGFVTSVERPDGRVTTIRYNALGLPERVTRPDGTSVRRTYDERGNTLTVIDAAGAESRFTYDVRGHLSSVVNALGETSVIRCDAVGRVVESTDPLGATTGYAYDAFGRPATMTDPLGGTVRLTWSVEGRLLSRIEPDGTGQSWTYDGEGNCLSHTDANGARSVYEFGDFDSLAARTGPDGARYTFAHDLELRLTEVTDPRGLTWTYEYDPAGRVIAETDFDGRTLHYAYDAAGQLSARTNALGEQVRYTYDALGRTARKDAGGAVSTYEYDHADQLARAVGPDVTLTRVRNREGLLHSETVDGRTTVYAYDALGRTTRRTTPSGAVSEWSYDAAGRRASLTASGRTLTFEYDATGRETVRRGPAGVGLSYGFDEVGRLTGQHLTGGDGRTLRRRGYSYRPDGHLVAVDDALGGTRTFTLDAAARVTAVDAGSWTERYAYDEAGNQTSASWPVPDPDAGSARGPRAYDGNRMVGAGGVGYTYDAQGRVVTKRTKRLSRKPDIWHYAWDAEDRLVGVTTPDGTVWRYLFDPVGRRTAKRRLSQAGEVVEEVLFTWEGASLVEQTAYAAELPHPVAVTWDYRGLHPLAQTERVLGASRGEIDSRFFSIVTDLVGTPTELVDEQGEVAWHTRSTLWGKTEWNRGASVYTPLRFPGQYFDPESGLHYNVFRTYDPETARYLSPDPLGLAPAPNPMAYVHNPHTWSDHLGLAPDECRITVYRKQTDHPLSQRVHVDENGNVRVDGNNHLYVNMSGELRHTLEFRGDSGQIVAFDVPKSFVDDIRARAVPQEQPDGFGFTKQEWKQVKQIYPEISDPTRGTDLYGLPGEVIDQMRKVIIPGSGRIIQDH
ncbi:putative T7SS-secreted protein [Streptomyces sp. NPDC055886]